MKRSPALRALSSEHHAGLVLARRALQAVTPEAVTQAWHELVTRFETELEPHFREEESWLLLALERLGESERVRRTLDEHSRLRALVYERAHDAEGLRLFAELLKAHIRFEERELFELAEVLFKQSGDRPRFPGEHA
jgi:hemerythrin